MYNVHISPEAVRDIREIYAYIAYDLEVENSAEQITAEIFAKIFAIKIFPEGYQIYEMEPWQSRNVRTVNARKYKIFYVVNNKTKTVEVLRVLYARRNLGKDNL